MSTESLGVDVRAQQLEDIVGGSYAYRYALAIDEKEGRVIIHKDGSVKHKE